MTNFNGINALIHLKFGGFGENLVVFKCIRPLIQKIMANFNCIKALILYNAASLECIKAVIHSISTLISLFLVVSTAISGNSSLETPDLRAQSVVSDQITRLRSMQPFQQNIFLLMKRLLGLGSA